MATGLGPENWLGVAVAVSVVGHTGDSVGMLVDVGDHGITMRLPAELDEDTGEWVDISPRLVFHPWSTITYLQVEESDLESGDAG